MTNKKGQGRFTAIKNVFGNTGKAVKGAWKSTFTRSKNQLKGQSPQQAGAEVPPPASYMPSMGGRPSFGAGYSAPPPGVGGGWNMEKTIFLVFSIFGVVMAFLILGPIFGIIAAVVAFLASLVWSGLGTKLIASKYFPIFAVVFIVIGLIIFVVYFYMVGGGQVFSGAGYQAETGISSIFQSFAFRSALNFVKNPFGINPEASQTEEVQTGTVAETQAPNQAFSIEVRKMIETVQFDQKALSFVITFKNEGGSRIERANVKIFSEQPKKGCLRFSMDQLPTNCYPSAAATAANEVKCDLEDIGAYSQKEIVITGVSVSKGCAETGLTAPLKSGVNMPIFVNIEASTYYPTSSRLTVERIKTDYGTLLFKNQLLLPAPTGAISRAGSAMTINLDIGDQPILDSVSQGGLIMNWMNTGEGQMDENRNPFLFIITPGNFGPCISSGFGANTVIIKTAATGIDYCYENARIGMVGCSEQMMHRVGKDSCGIASCANMDSVCFDDLDDKLQKKEIWNFTESETTFHSWEFRAALEATKCNGACCTAGDEDEQNDCNDSYKECVSKELNDSKKCYDEVYEGFDRCKDVLDAFTGDRKGVCSDIDITPNSTKCILCDSALEQTWCNESSLVYKRVESDAPSMKPVFDWVCSKTKKVGWTENDSHVCATNGLTEEFNIFTCSLDLCDTHNMNLPAGKAGIPGYDTSGCEANKAKIQTNENRVTEYVTAIALYPYKTATSTQIQAYTPE